MRLQAAGWVWGVVMTGCMGGVVVDTARIPTHPRAQVQVAWGRYQERLSSSTYPPDPPDTLTWSGIQMALAYTLPRTPTSALTFQILSEYLLQCDARTGYICRSLAIQMAGKRLVYTSPPIAVRGGTGVWMGSMPWKAEASGGTLLFYPLVTLGLLAGLGDTTLPTGERWTLGGDIAMHVPPHPSAFSLWMALHANRYLSLYMAYVSTSANIPQTLALGEVQVWILGMALRP